jgi:nucleotide-binding universal stress UspA family protein
MNNPRYLNTCLEDTAMLPIKTILVATDFSPMSEHAVHFAGALARDYGARLVAVHVIQTPVAVYAETAVFVEEPDRSAARAALAALRVPGVDFEYRLREGEPISTIVQVARETGTDLLVMGTHGRGGLLRVLLGSVAEGVLREAPCPVMTIKATVPLPITIEDSARAAVGT